MIPLFMRRIGIGEKMLRKKFGEEHLQYMKRTKKLIPFIY
jgi:protein-S-isoprenylcysteine O-methyltransferase Ste14